MSNYTFIRLTEELTVPSNAVFRDVDTSTDSHVLVSLPVYSDAGAHGSLIPVVSIQGEAAFALRAFLRGEITFPILGNGILDIPGGWSARRAAADLGGGLLGAVGGAAVASVAGIGALQLAQSVEANQQLGGQQVPLMVPEAQLQTSNGIDFSRVLARIKESKPGQ